MINFNVGEKIKVSLKSGQDTILIIQGKAHDEVLAVGPISIFASTKKYPSNTIVLATSRSYQGTRLHTGDKVVVVTKDGQTFKMYITQFLDSDAFVLSFKNNSSSTTLKWILDLMKST